MERTRKRGRKKNKIHTSDLGSQILDSNETPYKIKDDAEYIENVSSLSSEAVVEGLKSTMTGKFSAFCEEFNLFFVGMKRSHHAISITSLVDKAVTLLDELFSAEFADDLLFQTLMLQSFPSAPPQQVPDEFLVPLTDIYIADKRSREFAMKYMVGVLLFRSRLLKSPASRSHVRAIEICASRMPELTISVFLSKVIKPCVRVVDARTPSEFSTSFEGENVSYIVQQELLQRVIRQVLNYWFGSSTILS